MLFLPESRNSIRLLSCCSRPAWSVGFILRASYAVYESSRSCSTFELLLLAGLPTYCAIDYDFISLSPPGAPQIFRQRLPLPFRFWRSALGRASEDRWGFTSGSSIPLPHSPIFPLHYLGKRHAQYVGISLIHGPDHISGNVPRRLRPCTSLVWSLFDHPIQRNLHRRTLI